MQTGNMAFDSATNAAEGVRQTADRQALATFQAGGTQAAYDAALKTNSVAYFRAMIAACTANGFQTGVYRQALWELTGSET